MSDIFYFTGLLVFLISLIIQKNFLKIFEANEWFDKFVKISGAPPKDSDWRKEEDKFLFSIYVISSVIISVWSVIGLLTSNWIIFSILILLAYLINFIMRVSNSNWLRYAGLILHSFRSAIILFLVINNFHLKLDLNSTLLNLISI